MAKRPKEALPTKAYHKLKLAPAYRRTAKKTTN